MGATQISLQNFLLIYLLLIIVIAIMKKSNMDKGKILIWASFRMTVQLVLVGFILTTIFENPKPIFTILFLASTILFSIQRVLSTQKQLNKNFKIIIACSLTFSGLSVLFFFVTVIISQDFTNPQYTIPLSGMIIGNSMTGLTVGLNTFMSKIHDNNTKINTLINLGVHPKDILNDFANEALETALIPTINSMMGMGIIFLPGMMSGQILSGTIPTTAIMYQIAIMIAICTAVCLSVFSALHLGCKTLYNDMLQITVDN